MVSGLQNVLTNRCWMTWKLKLRLISSAFMVQIEKFTLSWQKTLFPHLFSLFFFPFTESYGDWRQGGGWNMIPW